MNRPKKAGTAHESSIVAILNAHGIPARRLAEGGSTDEGDIEAKLCNHFDGLWTKDDRGWCPCGSTRVVIEAKDCQALNAHAAYADARTKTTAPLLLAWRRMKPLTESRKRRTSAGTLWILDTPTLMRLLRRTEGGT